MSDADKQKMVGWYDPGQLLRTAGEVVISTVFGRNADQRLIEALFAGPDELQDQDLFQDYSESNELWLDYVADVGDGWNSTYAVAYHLSQPKLSMNYEGKRYDTVRGRALVFGGDEVYPTASRLEYKRRTFHPYDCAFHGATTSRPDMFAIPGNHDWYDSLVSFTRYFIDKDDIAGFRTPQLRSYFAMKLPHHWWLLATDMQLGSYIDGPQIEYFTRVATKINTGDSVIVCNAEPVWIYDHLYKNADPNIDDRNLDFFEKVILKDKSVRVFLAGDLRPMIRRKKLRPVEAGRSYIQPTELMSTTFKKMRAKTIHSDRVETLRTRRAGPPPTSHDVCAGRMCCFPFSIQNSASRRRSCTFSPHGP
jgi:hypothetical protein